jgi:catechol 2,3-dioxygenase-like lactoylglutathione lyase family enzyme
MDWTLEVVQVPVSDFDRAIAFYRDQVGFNLDFVTPAGAVQWAQLTPTGSGCSIQLAKSAEGAPMPPGSLRGLQLVVSDAEAARQHLLKNGVAAGTINVIDDRDGGTMFDFDDPDGNAWVVQQIKARAGEPLLPHRGG